MTRRSVVTAVVAAALLLPPTVMIAFSSLPVLTAAGVVAAAVAAHVAIAWLRARPGLALAVVTGSVALQGLLTGMFLFLPSSLLVLMVIHGSAAYGNRRAGLAVGALGSLLGMVRYAVEPSIVAADWGPAPWLVGLLLLALSAVAWALGLVRRAERRTAELATERLGLERRDRVHREAEAAAAERARISRDLHDVLAHSLTVIVGQARVARFQPDAADGALDVIEDTARDSLRDLRTTLRTLRDHGDTHPVSLLPHQRILDLPALAEGLRKAGLRVERVVEGTSRQLDPQVEMAIHRFVQEGLTNALRYGDGAVHWQEVWADSEVVITLHNAVPVATPASSPEATAGFGLLGMRERLAEVGATLIIDRRTGFTLTATLPYSPDSLRSKDAS